MPAPASSPELPGDLRWQSVLDHAFDAIVQTDAHGRIIGWNTQAERCFGWLRHEATGQLFHALALQDGGQQTFMQQLTQLAESAPGNAPGARVEVAAVHRTGHVFALEISLAINRLQESVEFIAFIRDVSERRSTDNALRIAATAFQTLEGMVITDADQIILKVNDAFSHITGYGASSAVGKKSAIFRAGRQDEAVYLELRKVLPVKRFWQGEVWDRRSNGERYPVWLRVTAVVDSRNRVTHYVAAFIDNTHRNASDQRIHYLDFYDPLTSLPNRRFLLDRLRQALATSQRKTWHGAVLLIDMDDFKSINDSLGHDIGDALLIQVSQRLKACVHAEDTLARLGGDEFVLILQGLAESEIATAAKAEIVAKRIGDSLQRPVDLKGHHLQISLSIGIALFCGDAAGAEELLKRAETAMYRAKDAGRNCVRFFDPDNQTLLEQRFAMTTWMRQGMPEQFSLHYQVQVDQAGKAIGAEALIRWKHPENGPVSPAMFIPLAEETGFIVPLGNWVLLMACQQLAEWSRWAGTCQLCLAVNVSARQFHADGFTRSVEDALRQTGATPTLLKLELTEGIMLSDTGAVIEKMLQLKRLGVSFAIDDFGTGYSSLSYLKRLPLDQLKIDQSFVRDLLTDPNDVAIARAIVGLGHSLGLTVIAEGVETAAQRDVLLDMQCDAFQGYYYGRPVDAVAFKSKRMAYDPVCPNPC